MTPGWAAVAAGVLWGCGWWLVLFGPAPGTGPERKPGRRGLRGAPVRVIGAAAAGVAVWIATGWPAAAVLAIAGGWWLPALLGPDRGHRQGVERIEAVAAWAEMLRDLMAGASGLHQAITATVPIAPEPIRADVETLAERLRLGRPAQEALEEFAETVDNPTADLVAAALGAAAGRHAADLGALLGGLAEAARDQSAMLVRVAANRARVRTATHIIIATTLGVAVFLILFSPDYLSPFDGAAGQAVLLAIGGLWALALVWLARLSRLDLGPRVLAPGPRRAVSP